jgi:hypothetical protein
MAIRAMIGPLFIVLIVSDRDAPISIGHRISHAKGDQPI